jgi:hypothetical protein
MSSNSNRRKRRRESPSYDDYLSGENAHGTSTGDRYIQPRLSERRESQPTTRGYHAGSQYGNYRRESDEEQERLLRHKRSASPGQERTMSPPYLFRNPSPSLAHRLGNLSPPPRRAEPTDDYLLTSLEHSRRVDDPTRSRKLVVLDLNGSLLLRSPRVPRASRLRTVHPRPYLAAFRSYLFHEETKPWLDAMVWSSAQPHSVHDMVEKCFRDRKKELRAIWARDTLGLNQYDYRASYLYLLIG